MCVPKKEDGVSEGGSPDPELSSQDADLVRLYGDERDDEVPRRSRLPPQLMNFPVLTGAMRVAQWFGELGVNPDPSRGLELEPFLEVLPFSDDEEEEGLQCDQVKSEKEEIDGKNAPESIEGSVCVRNPDAADQEAPEDNIQ